MRRFEIEEIDNGYIVSVEIASDEGAVFGGKFAVAEWKEVFKILQDNAPDGKAEATVIYRGAR